VRSSAANCSAARSISQTPPRPRSSRSTSRSGSRAPSQRPGAALRACRCSASGWPGSSWTTALPLSAVVGSGAASGVRSGASRRARSSASKRASSCGSGRRLKGATWARSISCWSCIASRPSVSKRASGPCACSASVSPRAQAGRASAVGSVSAARRACSGSGASAPTSASPCTRRPCQRRARPSARWRSPSEARRSSSPSSGAARPGSARRSTATRSTASATGSRSRVGAAAGGASGARGAASTLRLCAPSSRTVSAT